MRPHDHILVGVDICQNVEKVMEAYGQELECWKGYILNGLSNAGRLLELDVGNVLATASHWEYVAKWDIQENRHVVSDPASAHELIIRRFFLINLTPIALC
jgi:uncharacterized SAM-dependent methyltransferase